MNPMIVAGEGDAVSVLPANVVTALQQGVDKVAQGGQEGLVAILPERRLDWCKTGAFIYDF